MKYRKGQKLVLSDEGYAAFERESRDTGGHDWKPRARLTVLRKKGDEYLVDYGEGHGNVGWFPANTLEERWVPCIDDAS